MDATCTPCNGDEAEMLRCCHSISLVCYAHTVHKPEQKCKELKEYMTVNEINTVVLRSGIYTTTTLPNPQNTHTDKQTNNDGMSECFLAFCSSV